MTLKTRDNFRILKRSVESALACLSIESTTPPKFPSLEFTTCILLVALKVLEARNQLDRLDCTETSLESVADIPILIEKLKKLTDRVCPQEIRSSVNFDVSGSNALHFKDKVAEAIRHLCQTPDEVWVDDFTIGYAYQFLSMAGRKNAQANIQTANKELSQIDLIAFTQLYTPGWVVDFLLANCLLPQLQEATAKCAPEIYSVWNLEQTIKGKLSAEAVTILDPACGAGNFLLRAMDLMINLHMKSGMSAEQSVNAVQSSNIHGADIDLAALWITCLSLLIKSFQYSKTAPTSFFRVNIASEKNSDNLLGSLERNFESTHVLARSHSVILMNPPYIGRKLMSRQLKSALKENYANSHSDISAAFIERSLELLNDGGRLGTITQASVLTLPSYGNLRKKLLNDFNLIACADAGTGVFPLQGGDKVNSALIVIENKNPTAKDSYFFDLRTDKNKSEVLMAQSALVRNSEPGTYFSHDQKIFLAEHESAIKYGCPSLILSLARQVPSLADVADIRQGLATTNNERFIKKIEDVPIEFLGSSWMPYIKGAGTDRWFSPVAYAVNWANNGQEIKDAVTAAYPYLKGNTKWVVKNEQFYFRSGLCFSFVNTGNLAVRKLPSGCIFDVGASAVFANDKSDEDFLLAYLNSSLISAIANSINPTINFQVGDIKRLPMFPFNRKQKDELAELARRCCALNEELHSLKRAVVVMVGVGDQSSQPQREHLSSSLSALESSIDDLVLETFYESFALTSAQRNEISAWLIQTTKN
ncbi:hypothetical protein BH10CYA1_BH10CYA1_58220 [soil metagenome]